MSLRGNRAAPCDRGRQRGPEGALGHHGEDLRVAPVLVDAGPVVEGRHHGSLLGGLQAVAVDVADLRADLPQDRPGDESVLLELADLHRDVVTTQWEVVEGLAVHVHDEAVADPAHRVPVGVLQHARRIDRHMALRVAQHGEDVRGGSGDRAGHLDAIGHASMVSREWSGSLRGFATRLVREPFGDAI